MSWSSWFGKDDKQDGKSKPEAPLRPTREAPNQGRGGAAALLRNRGRSIDEQVDRMSRGEPARSYSKGGSVSRRPGRPNKINKPSW